MKIISIKWLPYLSIIFWFQLIDPLSADEPKSEEIFLRSIQETIEPDNQIGVTRMINDLSLKYSLKDFDDCFEPSYRKRNLNLFQQNFSLSRIIENYYADEQNKINRLSLTLRKQKIQTFVKNVQSLIQEVETCLSSPVDERTKVGFTSLTDWTDDEFRKMRGFKRPPQTTGNFTALLHRLSRAKKGGMSKGGDFRKIVTPIKNQYFCKSSFIFSAVSIVETSYIWQQHKTYDQCKIDLSEQAILDCQKDIAVCHDGGYPSDAWNVMKFIGIFDESAYPYKGYKRNECLKAPTNKWGIRISFFYQHQFLGTEELLESLVWMFGSVVVGIDTSRMKFLRGKFNKDCPNEIDQFVTVVGHNENYWIIKNSWGTDWGIKGYLYLKRGGNRCGILLYMAFAVLENGTEIMKTKI